MAYNVQQSAPIVMNAEDAKRVGPKPVWGPGTALEPLKSHVVEYTARYD